MREALNDENNRVAGNALLGLHLLHEPNTAQRLVQMLGDARPKFRRTAAWLMGKIARPEFKDHLLQAAGDEDAGVRETATRALAAFPTPEQTKEAESPPASTPPWVRSGAGPADPPQEDEKPVEPPADLTFDAPRLDGRSTRCR